MLSVIFRKSLQIYFHRNQLKSMAERKETHQLPLGMTWETVGSEVKSNISN